MSKVHPYGSDAELKALAEQSKSFAFDPQPESHTKLAILVGKEGTGKTHLACTMCEVMPVYLFDTEYRAWDVVRKFKGGKHPLYVKQTRTWNDMVVGVKTLIHRVKQGEFQPGVIVLDSGSDLQVFAEVAYLQRTKAEKVWPQFNWSEVWGMCNALIDDIKWSPFQLIMTARIKEEYKADKPTGKEVARIYSTLPYKADVIIQFSSNAAPGRFVKPEARDGKERYVPRDRSMPEIIKLAEEI